MCEVALMDLGNGGNQKTNPESVDAKAQNTQTRNLQVETKISRDVDWQSNI